MCLITLSAIITKYIYFKIQTYQNKSLLDFCSVISESSYFCKMLFRSIICFDWVQKEILLYYRFKMIPTYRLLRRQERDLESFQVVIVMPTYDDMI